VIAPIPVPVLAALLAHVLLSAGTFLIAKVAVGQFDPLALAQLRFVLAAAALLGLSASRGPLRLPPRELWGPLAVLGLLGAPINQGLFLLGLKRTSAAHSALLYAATPVVVLCLALARGQERLRADRAFGIVLAFAGVAVLLFGRGLAFERRWLVGDLLVFAAVIAWAVYTVRSKELLGRIAPLALTANAMTAGALLFLPIGIPAVLAQDYGRVTAMGWAGLAYVSFLTSVVSYLIWSWALARIEASRVAVFTNLQPLVTALLAWGLLGEPLTLHFLGATVAILAGVALAERR
jgi:drug/metabolite transporter (DMT)-like permease